MMDAEDGAQEQAVDISDDRSAAGGDAAFGEEVVEDGEILVDTFGGREVLGLANQGGEEGGVVLGLAVSAGMVETEGACGVGGGLAAAAFESAMLAARGCLGCELVDHGGFEAGHDVFLRWWSVLLTGRM